MRVIMPSRILDRHVGGNTTYARRLVDGLSNEGVEIGRIAAHKNPILTMLEEISYAPRKGHNGDVLHFVADTGPLTTCRRPSVLTLHGVASRWINTARTPTQEAVWRFRVRRAISAVDKVITVSESSSRDISTIFDIPREKLVVIPHGIDVEHFSEPTSPFTGGEHALPEDYALYVGNIEPRKNLLPLIEAFETPQLRALGIPLIIAGKPAWNYKETMAAIEKATNVKYIGFVTDEERVALMQHCSLFVFPSLYEGFGFPVLEALAAGAVVACSNRGSLSEVAGPAIRLTDLSRDGLSQAIVGALEDSALRDSCKENGKDWASSFSWSKSVLSHIGVYGEITK